MQKQKQEQEQLQLLEADKKEQARRRMWTFKRVMSNNFDDCSNYVCVPNYCLQNGDDSLFLNALGPDARKASKGFIFRPGSQFEGSSYWWVTVANVAKWVTVNDQAIREEDMMDDFVVDLARNADSPAAGGFKFIKTAQS